MRPSPSSASLRFPGMSLLSQLAECYGDLMIGVFFGSIYPKDCLQVKLIVATLFLAATVYCVTTTGWLYEDLIVKFGQYDSIFKMSTWFIIQLQTSSQKEIVLAVIQYGVGIWLSVIIQDMGSLLAAPPILNDLSIISSVLVCVTDLFITVELCYLLHNCRSGVKTRSGWVGLEYNITAGLFVAETKYEIIWVFAATQDSFTEANPTTTEPQKSSPSLTSWQAQHTVAVAVQTFPPRLPAAPSLAMTTTTVTDISTTSVILVMASKTLETTTIAPVEDIRTDMDMGTVWTWSRRIITAAIAFHASSSTKSDSES
ncbi:hypothetical protein D9758_011744 [Tetrapyrgos nigripes]|uniref:Uncharacterized protein n=1 Tax=Tetrapyrgos nigripes TaxID=182062 RepID=A0A8H5GD11_9AGAR|nr:hypothetical protein D9758_011744 [Tetrapyrgos nigripes]